MNLSYKHIAHFLNVGQNRSSRAFSYFGLGIGVLLLLCSVQMYFNINQLIRDKNPRKNGFDYISITKNITNQNMGKDNRFSPDEVAAIKTQPFLNDAAALVSNQFRVKASAGSILPLSTDLFLEGIQDNFLDTLPPNFKWQQGQAEIPIILSSDFLEMYNVFAPAQDLPQLSATSIGIISLFIECYGPSNQPVVFKGRIIAVSDRINSILVPLNFLEFANKNLANSVDPPAGRVYLKTVDANNPELLAYLQQKDYHVNKDKTQFGRVKQVLQAIVSGLAAFAVLVILLAMMLFSFYLQLMIARSKDNLQLLLTLGYSPGWLSKTVAKRWVPVYVSIVLIALAITQVLQYVFQQAFPNGTEMLSSFLHPVVVLVGVGLMFLCIVINYRLIRKLLYKL